MPHKQNPVLGEIMIALARHAAGQQGTLVQAMIHEQGRSGAALALEWLALPATAEATGASLRHTTTLFGSATRLGSSA
jgi:3-carboxy-cis,cis-muconate cycloisomerase